MATTATHPEVKPTGPCFRPPLRAVPALLLVAAIGLCADAAQAGDGSSIYLNVLPPGSNGNAAGGIGLPIQGIPAQYPPNFVDQAALYGDLSYAQPGLRTTPCRPPVTLDKHVAASNQVCNYFKHDGLTPDKVVSSERLKAPSGKTVTIKRDGWGVPFITASSRTDAMYGFGYAQAEDRLWLLDVLRNVGRGQTTKFLGPAPEFEQLDAGFALTAGYSEDELTQMVDDTAAKLGSLGTMVLQDIDADVAGINAYVATLSGANSGDKPPEYALLKQGGFPPPAFTRNDIVASAIFIQSLFAVGGGSEATNELMLQQMDPTISAGLAAIPTSACRIWRDIRHADDPGATRTTDNIATESPSHLDESCPQTLPAGAAIWDYGSYQPYSGYVVSDPVSGTARRTLHGHISVNDAPAAHATAVKYAPSAKAARKPIVALSPYEQLRHALRAAGFGLPSSMSNWMAVTAAQSKSGHPIGIMGPQSSYYDPELLWEVSIHSTGKTAYEFDGRGMVFGNLPYLLIGRGPDYAWSATSGDSDLVDTRVSKLCNIDGSMPSLNDANQEGFPDADGYLYDVGDGKGPQCRAFYKRTDSWLATPTVASAGSSGTGKKQITRHILRTHYGPVFATAMVNGWPVAISTQRTTFYNELLTAAPFAITATPAVSNAKKFQQLFNGVTGTFNWLYLDKQDVAYLQSGLLPVRNAGQSPDLPVWGDGRFEWAADKTLPANFFSAHGGSVPYPGRATPVAVNGGPLSGGYYEWQNYLPLASHPQDLNPPKGYILSWNNSPAKGWWAADSRPNWGPVHRVDIERPRFDAFLATGNKFDFANVVEIMADSAFTDLRGQELLPLLLQIMNQGTLTADQQQVVTLMQQWLDDGSLSWINGKPGLGAWRRDRDGDGQYDYRPQVVLMDAWYLHLMDTMTPQLAALDPGVDAPGLTSCVSNVLLCRHDAPRQQGSAYEYGWYQVMDRMLQTALNVPGHTDYRGLRCAGTGSYDDCRGAVLTALDAALNDLGGIGTYKMWNGRALPNEAAKNNATVENYDAIDYQIFGLLADPQMPWMNRPTYQQVIEIH